MGHVHTIQSEDRDEVLQQHLKEDFGSGVGNDKIEIDGWRSQGCRKGVAGDAYSKILEELRDTARSEELQRKLSYDLAGSEVKWIVGAVFASGS